MGLFTTYLLNRRLAAENKTLRGKVEYLDGERERLIKLLLERDMLWADQVITASGRYGIADQAKANVQPPKIDEKYNEQRDQYLEAIEARMVQDAIDAGLSPEIARSDFARERDEHIARFNQSEQSFVF